MKSSCLRKEKKRKTIAIVGSGPAGLSAARELARLGYTVTIFEAKEKAGDWILME